MYVRMYDAKSYTYNISDTYAVYTYHCGMDDHEKTCMKLLPLVAALLCMQSFKISEAV